MRFSNSIHPLYLKDVKCIIFIINKYTPKYIKAQSKRSLPTPSSLYGMNNYVLKYPVDRVMD